MHYRLPLTLHHVDNIVTVSEFCEFVVNQELCRKRWLESERQYEELTVHLEEVERDNDALKTKLKHARLVFLDVNCCRCKCRLC